MHEEDLQPNNKHREYLKKFITKQQKKYGKIYDVFNETEFVNDMRYMMENYKQLLHQYSQERINKDKYLKKDNDDYWTERLKYPLFKNLLNINEIKKSLQQKKNRIREALEKKKKRSMPLDDSSERNAVKKLKSSKNDTSVDDIKMDISCKAQNSNISPKKILKQLCLQ